MARRGKPPVEHPPIRVWREVLNAVLLDAAETTPRTAKSVILCLLGCLDDDEAFQVFEHLLTARSGAAPGTFPARTAKGGS
jgi:hypothetical protein